MHEFSTRSSPKKNVITIICVFALMFALAFFGLTIALATWIFFEAILLAVFFIVQLAILILSASIRAIASYAIPLLAASFLIGGIIVGLTVCEKKKDTFEISDAGLAVIKKTLEMTSK